MRHLGLALLFVSFSSLACPDLSGTYAKCTPTSPESTSTSDMVVTQAVVNGAMNYSSTTTDDESGQRTTDTIVANGQPSVTVDSSEGYTVVETITATCMNNSLVIEIDETIEGESLAQITSIISRQGNALVYQTTGMILDQPFNDTTICQ